MVLRLNLRVYSFFKFLICLSLAGCGIESTIPSQSDTGPSESQRAVAISQVVQTGTGSIITCELNSAIVDPDTTIPLFLEYEGVEIQRIDLTNQTEFTFNEYNPPADGEILCVVEYADAEFESLSRSLSHIP